MITANNKDVNIALFNLKDTSSDISFDFTDIGLKGKAAIRDIGKRSDLGIHKKDFINSYCA